MNAVATPATIGKHPCPECGGDTEWDAAKQTLCCPYCGTLATWSPGEDPMGAAIVEHELAKALQDVGNDQRGLRDWLGYEGARWFYVCMGGFVLLMGLGLTFTTSGYASLVTRRRSPERPVFAVRQEHVTPQVSRPAAPPPPPASANRSALPAAPATAGGKEVMAGERLPGTWRQLEGGLCIKIPASIQITEDSVKSTGRGKAQQISGHTQIGKVLAHALSETARKKVNAVVFIGDAMEEEIDDLAEKAGRLGLLGVPVFLFQEGADTAVESAFREIARLSKGAWFRFDRNAAATLARLLSAVALFATGGQKALAARGRPEDRLLIENLRGGGAR